MIEPPLKTPPELLASLAVAGIQVQDVWDLVNSKAAYPAGIPILLDWLEHFDERITKDPRDLFREGLVRALTVAEARPIAAPVLLREFKKAKSSPSLCWAIGNALSVVATQDYLDDLLDLVQDKDYGTGRREIVSSLGRYRDARVVPVLTNLLQDNDVSAHALEALRRLKPPDIRRWVEPLLHDPRPLVRREAHKTLAKLPD